MEGFSIYIKCNLCGSIDVKTNLDKTQEVGTLELVCDKCVNYSKEPILTKLNNIRG